MGGYLTFVKFTPYDTKKIRLNERILRVDFVTVNLPPQRQREPTLSRIIHQPEGASPRFSVAAEETGR